MPLEELLNIPSRHRSLYDTIAAVASVPDARRRVVRPLRQVAHRRRGAVPARRVAEVLQRDDVDRHASRVEAVMKIKATLGGRETLILGLSHANLDRLRADGLTAKILIDGRELGIGLDIWLTAAEDEAVMMRAFQEGITAGTKVHIDKKFKS